MKPKITVNLLKGHPPDEVADFDVKYESAPGMENVSWPDVRWCDVHAVFWAPWEPRPRGYVSARKKKTRRERRWRRRNRR